MKRHCRGSSAAKETGSQSGGGNGGDASTAAGRGRGTYFRGLRTLALGAALIR